MENDGGWVIKVLTGVLRAESLEFSRLEISLRWGCGYFYGVERVFLQLGTRLDVLTPYRFIISLFRLFLPLF